MKESNKFKSSLLSIVCLLVVSFISLSGFLFSFGNKTEEQKIETPVQCFDRYSFDLIDYHFDDHQLKRDQVLSDLLRYQGINLKTIYAIEKASRDVFNIRNFNAGNDITLVRNQPCEEPICMVYEPDVYSYIIYPFDTKKKITKVTRPREIKIGSLSGEIETSLWDALVSESFTASIIDEMESALSSNVDFYNIQMGDQYKIIYEQIFVEDDYVGVGNVLGAYFKNDQGEHFAYYFENDRYGGHYDEEGQPTKSAFLRDPVKFSRISSRFSYSRFHPIKKKRIPHLGTDYAAPRGTPIYAVANGVIEKASYTRGNGKYIRIKHDDTYKSQYLHMNGFAKGMKSGVAVKQGDIIGYVGSTGLATGPHVCFRFWKNGKQINHLRENFPPSDPLPTEEMDKFFAQKDDIQKQLIDIDIDSSNQQVSGLISE